MLLIAVFDHFIGLGGLHQARREWILPRIILIRKVVLRELSIEIGVLKTEHTSVNKLRSIFFVSHFYVVHLKIVVVLNFESAMNTWIRIWLKMGSLNIFCSKRVSTHLTASKNRETSKAARLAEAIVVDHEIEGGVVILRVHRLI